MKKDVKDLTAEEIRGELETIKYYLKRELISYDKAKELAKPIIDEMNRRGELIAKKHGKRFKRFTFLGLGIGR
jgi:hypothetical protein